MIQPGLKGPRENKEQCGIVIKDEEPRRRNGHVTDDCAYTTAHLKHNRAAPYDPGGG